MKFVDVMWVGVGGFCGTLLRYGVGVVCQALPGSVTFPIATCAVNVLGCFLMGMLHGSAVQYGISKETVTIVGVGILGGFTTFSALGFDWLRLVQANRVPTAIVYVVATLALGFLAVYAGWIAGGRLNPAR